MIPRAPPYTAASWRELACVQDDWENGDPFAETMWFHMLNIVPSGWQGQENPDIFEVIEGKATRKKTERPRCRTTKHRQVSLEEAFA